MDDAELQDMEAALKALGNITRLRLLRSLQTPKGYRDLLIPATRSDDGGGSAPISRPALVKQVGQLRRFGLVQEVEGNGRESRFVVDHARLFEVLEQVRQLAAVRPSIDIEQQTTPQKPGADALALPEGPHLLLVRGVREGRAFALAGEGRGRDAQAWIIGRGADCQVRLDYDAYVSHHHARIVRSGGRYLLHGLPTGRNGTFVDWTRLRDDAMLELMPGAVIAVGLSLLVFRP